MSHFSSITTKLTDPEALTQGLTNLLAAKGINAQIEVHDSPVKLISDYSRRDIAYGQIVIRRTYLNTPSHSALLDVGFLWDEKEGGFQLQADPWDFNQNALGKAFTKDVKGGYSSPVNTFVDEVQLAHDRAYINIHYPPELWNYTETALEDGSTRITLSQKPSLTESVEATATW
ncbi:hypothetical protein [Coleofasciculus sp. E2-BRE-01]|uniref:hypothetical protein n=1 Tax=unclassified Coleofasciculus TaxID=2692782 RepID=UPI0032F2BDD8